MSIDRSQAAQRPIRIIVITEPERTQQDWIERLAKETWVERIDRVGSLNGGVELARRSLPDVVLVDRTPEQAEAAIRQIFTSAPQVLCLAIVPELSTATMRRLVQVGARDVLSQPVPYTDLITSIRATLATETDRRQIVASPTSSTGSKRGKLIVVMAPKGGVGTTTIAVNLAVALRQIIEAPIALVDFGLQFGAVGVHLNLWSRHTMHDLITNTHDIDDAVMNRVLQEHKSGVRVLLAPNEPESVGDITGEKIGVILDQLLGRHAYVIADVWSFIDEISLTLVERADELLIVTTPEVPTLKNAKHFLEYIQRHQLTQGRVTLVLNRFPSVEGVSLQDVQGHLRYAVGANIPSDGQMTTYSINRGIPLMLSHPQSWVARSIQKLATFVTGDQVDTLSLTPDDGTSGKQKSDASRQRRGFFNLSRRRA